MPETPARIAVIGGGIAGLVAARDLAVGGAEVELFEAEDRLGGKLRAVSLGGSRFDVGAEAFATRTGAVANYLAELGLADRIVSPAALSSWRLHGTRAFAMPECGAIGIPTAPLSAAARRALGLAGALRAAIEPLLSPGIGGNATTLAGLVEARLGKRVLDRLVRPVALGVYSTDPTELPIQAAPGLVAAFAQEGSLVHAAARLRDHGRASGSAVGALPGGMAPLAEALERELAGLGVRCHTGAPVASIEREGCSWRVAVGGLGADGGTDGGLGAGADANGRAGATADGSARTDADAGAREHLEFDGVVLAVPEDPARALLGHDFGTGAEADPGLTPHTVEVIALLVARPELDAAPRGTGALVSPGRSGHAIAAKALTHVTAKWPDRAAPLGPGEHVIRLSYGRRDEAPATLGLADVAARELARRDASTILGVTLDSHDVRDFARQRWAMPAPAPAADALPELPRGIVRTGDAVAGTGLAATIPHARRAARALLAELAGAHEQREHQNHDHDHTIGAGAASLQEPNA